MKAILHRSPDMVLETVALLYLEPNYERAVESMRALFGGEMYGSVHSRYVSVFRAHRSLPAGWRDFANMSVGEYLIVLFTALQIQDFLFRAQAVSEETLRVHLNNSFLFARDSGVPFIDYGTAETVFQYADTKNCTAPFRALLTAPSAYFTLLCDTVRENISAAELAWDSVRAEVNTFADKYWRDDWFFPHSVLSADGSVREVYPMLAVPSSAFILGDICYCGVYNVKTDGDTACSAQKDFLLHALKALADPKRLEIAVLLAQAPRYNRELAQLTGLTPATVMHHTDKLLQCGLVSIAAGRENQKKIYFQIERKTVELLKNAIGDLLT